MRMSEEQLYKNRHSLSHIMTMAVLELYPDAGLGVGPVIENGFYQDYDLPEPISDEIFKKLEKRMREIIKQKISFEQHHVGFKEALKEYKDDPYKTELIKELKEKGEKDVSFYKSDWFENLCLGPHVDSTQEIDPTSFKLTKVAGSYWRGDEKNQMLTRIYGVAFANKKDLKAHLAMLEEAKKRDHRKLGKELDLFTFSDLVGPGLPLFTPRGTVVRNMLDEFVWTLRRARGYAKVEIPHITKKDLYEKSGHWEKFEEDLFKIETREGHEFAMKPMNCPHHTQIYKRRKWSYRDMPRRYANTTMVYRDEQTGELSGLARVRSITQDDAHVFCRESQVKVEAFKIWDIIETFYGAFGFELSLRLSSHDPKHMENYLGDEKTWDKAVDEFKSWLKERKADYIEGVGEAAFYGPKIDFIAKDSIGREWQVATIQMDRSMPESFDLTCVNEKGEDERIVMIHAAIMGAIERFMAVLIEHVAGSFPMWLAPEQIRLSTVSEDYIGFAEELREKLADTGLRVELDASNEKVGKKIRDAAKMKIPWTIVIGEKEVGGGDFSVRVFGQDEDLTIKQKDLIKTAQKASKLPS